MGYILKLDTVNGHEVNSGIGFGRISRMGLATTTSLPGATPTHEQLTNILYKDGLPAKGDRYIDDPDSDFYEYFLKQHNFRAVDAHNYVIEMIYEFRGILTVRDTSSLTTVPTQLHPSDFSPIYVEYAGGMGTGIIRKLATMQTTLPLRHVMFNQTVDHTAGEFVLDAFGGVNDRPYRGKPIGYWLFSALEAESSDGGITKTYSATITTKQKENWLQHAFLEDDRGKPIYVPPAIVSAARNVDYFYGKIQNNWGITIAGMYPLIDMATVFGI